MFGIWFFNLSPSRKKAIYKWCWFLFKIKFTLHHFGQCYIASLRPVFTFDHVVFDFSENVFDHVLVEKHFSENVFRQERDRKHGSQKNPLELGLWMNRAHVFPAYSWRVCVTLNLDVRISVLWMKFGISWNTHGSNPIVSLEGMSQTNRISLGKLNIPSRM